MASNNPFSASVLPVGTQNPGDNVAKPLAVPPGSAPESTPNNSENLKHGTNKMIVVFKPETPHEEVDKAEEDIRSQGGKVTQSYRSALLGFAAEMPDFQVQTLTTNPNLHYMEPDGEVTAYAQSLISK
ncbi:hypothetical protein BCR41DRAFT_346715 [Lobosporangium transversale]|uniref:Inhibitor I9 domain-containing protein n=1 Tax=Lobosporangium transversale TaxID=64571 RepID=A0A1Y2H0X2_9FUNG|nr:hypothetical protein BCR41DRAFT_346715 [Lobosporangium transversale]ORZ27373.1 hypothetical protein BCR41DRAFT_346715 [Lobosporangium transversale]|eukprot:XP_021885100.1 hypothetical protein BCR41DRAFT_346715 [Lobosporangium transversale]